MLKLFKSLAGSVKDGDTSLKTLLMLANMHWVRQPRQKPETTTVVQKIVLVMGIHLALSLSTTVSTRFLNPS
jgi:hypothetical protein